MKKLLFFISMALILTQLLSIAYIRELFSSVASPQQVLSSSRNSTLNAFILPIVFIIAINLYLFLFRFKISLKLFRLYFLAISLFSWLIILSILFPYIYIGAISNILFIIVLLSPFVLMKTKYRYISEDIFAMSLSSIAGASLALMFSLKSLFITIALLSLLDYYFVLKNKKIVKIAEKMKESRIPIGIAVGSEKNRMALGYGDLIFSAGLVSAAFIDGGFAEAISIGFFASLSLFLYLSYFMKKGKALPALPPIFIGSLVGAIVSWVLI